MLQPISTAQQPLYDTTPLTLPTSNFAPALVRSSHRHTVTRPRLVRPADREEHPHAHDGHTTVAVGTYLHADSVQFTSVARTTCGSSVARTTHPKKPSPISSAVRRRRPPRPHTSHRHRTASRPGPRRTVERSAGRHPGRTPRNRRRRRRRLKITCISSPGWLLERRAHHTGDGRVHRCAEVAVTT